ncbi:hypothetical protein [Roseobacter sp. OBYS 0001]|uniref:hypothetical protein n=1 Tax=Roseobacter sp. OBYS 0001 TaxID=882651 RepID=UPI001BC3C883|nr:hypothetical protein [Roseobacter sp. OBYS 0001]GIT86168.1 hypothetical protein ROBYS_11840 [Roseobacter sp. OBYS 0001]
MKDLPQEKLDQIARDIVLGRMTMNAAANSIGFSNTSVARYMSTVTEADRVAILAQAAHDAKLRDAMTNVEVLEAFGEDTDKDLKWVLRELKTLLEDAKGDEDRQIQLGTLKELRASLMALADLSGKLNRRMEVHLNLNESPQFLQLREIILRVLEHHPEAKRSFLQEMQALNVIQAKALP